MPLFYQKWQRIGVVAESSCHNYLGIVVNEKRFRWLDHTLSMYRERSKSDAAALTWVEINVDGTIGYSIACYRS